MRVARSFVASVLTALVAFGATGQAVAASHRSAGQGKSAEKPAALATGRHVGTVKAVDPAAGTLAVTEKDGDATVSVGEKTAIKKGKETLKLADLKPGDEVAVVYVKEGGKDVARSIMVKAK